MKRLLYISVCVVGFSLPTLATAQAEEPPDFLLQDGRLPPGLAELGLQGAQRDQVQRIVDGARSRGRTLRRERREAARALRELLEQDPPNRDAVMAQARTIGQIETDLRLHRLDTMLRVRQVLTPAQRAAFRSRRRARREAVRNACQADVERLCPRAEGGLALRCMARHRAELSTTCRDALREQRRLFRGRRGPPWRERGGAR